MEKTYVIDTNVLIQSPYALNSFEENKVVLPIAVLEELDKLKNDEGNEVLMQSQAIRYLEQLRQVGSLFEACSDSIRRYHSNRSKFCLSGASPWIPYGIQ